ncbi:hypothetical protein SV7mr_20120 [Stieleria bergensis]|uniref:Uncharacterized protein n=1 Tax=Stieleria bergensis TaxID=2528025 RepID=A0A517STQ2_9BACT|nr:hypothetical protein SV7mr_20120 [Planctomycetes bacterium SV_7m_r]
MFGFLSGPKNDRPYRQRYAMCCSMLKRQAGLRALPFVSYEALFAISMAIDDGLLPQPPESTATCCKLRSSVCQQAFQQSSETDARTLEAALRYFAAFSVLLAETKLKDDVSDSRSPLAWLGLRVLRKQRRDAAKELRQIDERNFVRSMKRSSINLNKALRLKRCLNRERYALIWFNRLNQPAMPLQPSSDCCQN